MTEPLSNKHRNHLLIAEAILDHLGEKALSKKIGQVVKDRQEPDGDLLEYRPEGTRNFIRVGDTVKVKPSKPGKRDGYEAKVSRIEGNPDGTPKAIHVIGGPKNQFRTYFPNRIARVNQARVARREK